MIDRTPVIVLVDDLRSFVDGDASRGGSDKLSWHLRVSSKSDGVKRRTPMMACSALRIRRYKVSSKSRLPSPIRKVVGGIEWDLISHKE
ncbi:hypothetical protein AB0C07_18000 [Actinoplanes missouriensis]|uniref:hypothetical protein n=1 Tax=Actinoplanes missouriensis TaxID=1866 RepID=UPI0033DF8973